MSSRMLCFFKLRTVLPAVLLAISTLLTGCVTDQPGPVASTPVLRGQAAITITRTNAYVASAVAADIEANGSKIASLDNGAAFSGGVPAGPVTLTVTCWCGPGRYSIHFNAQAGKRYAFEVSPRDEQVVAVIAGGLVGLAAETVISGEQSGSFKILQVSGNRT